MKGSSCAMLLAGLVVSLFAALQPAHCQPMPAWVGRLSAVAGLDPATFARINPAIFFSTMVGMTPTEQRIYLRVIGEGIRSELHTTCNIFGGQGACQALDKDSKFARICEHHDLKVDCAHYLEANLESIEDPSAVLKQELSTNSASDLEQSCPQCFENQRRLWCAQTAPKCGSFQSLVEEAVLPALVQVSKDLGKGKNELEALAEATPALADALSLSLPCREMCEAVVSSCSCKQTRTFGYILQSVLDSKSLRIAHGLPQHLTKQIFGSLLDRPLCSLFARKNISGFAGHCDELPQSCDNEERWCHGDSNSNPGPNFVEQQLALQLAKGLFGWIGDPVTGLLQDRQAAVEVADQKDIKELELKYIRKAESGVGDKVGQSKAATGGTSAGVMLLIVCLVLVCGMFGGLALYNHLSKKMNIDTDSHGYVEIPVHVTEAMPSAV